MTDSAFRGAAITSILITAILAVPAIGQTADAPAMASLTDLSQQAWTLAGQGKLEEAWRVVEEAPTPLAEDPRLAALQRELDTMRSHEQQRRDNTRTACDEKIAELTEHLEQGKLGKALADAVEAHDLTDEPEPFLDSPMVKRLVAESVAAAVEAEEDADWLEALMLYRLLNLLFDDHDIYAEKVKSVAAHVRLLRTYAPGELFDLQTTHAERHEEDAPRAQTIDDEEWKTTLGNIELRMLHESLGLAAQQHVEPTTSYRQLMIGGIEALQSVLRTPTLATTFPNMGDAGKVEPFADYLAALKHNWEQQVEPMGPRDAVAYLNRLMDQNRLTVNLPPEVIIHEFGEGALATLDDYSAVVWPYQKERFERMTKGSFTGVGIQITLADDGQLTVVSPLEDTPAHRAGVRPEDRIMTIDGQTTAGITLDQAVDQITGPKRTTVVLGVLSKGDDKTRDLTLVREQIRIVSVKGWKRRLHGGWDFYIDPTMGIGYVRLNGFAPDSAVELDAAVKQLQEQRGLNGLVLDLRHNPGGLLSAAVEVSDRFLDSEVIVSTKNPASTGKAWRATATRHHTHKRPDGSLFPMVVLINRGSASASEIVSGALQAHRRAIVVGERSYGKGSVQNVFPLWRDKAKLKLTTQYYMVPDGRIIHRRPDATVWGIDPDVEVRVTDQQVATLLKARMDLDILREGDAPDVLVNDVDDADAEDEPHVESADDILTQGLDPQLEAAVLLLKTALIGEPMG